MSTADTVRSGVLELHPKGHGYLRDPKRNYRAASDDVVVAGPLLSRLGLRPGLKLTGTVEAAPKRQGPRLAEITEIEGRPTDDYPGRAAFDDLTAIDPHEPIRLEVGR